MPRQLAIAVCVVLSAASGWAGLGQDRLCVEGPVQRHTQNSTRWGVRYTQLRIVLDSGTVVQAFCDRSGSVFAVSWSGPFLPDLRDLLGAHFASLSEQQRRPGPGGNIVRRNGQVVIVSEGRLGGFQGRAWLPGRLPVGFDPGELR